MLAFSKEVYSLGPRNPMSMIDPIADVRAKVARAEKHLADLKEALAPALESRYHPVRRHIEAEGEEEREIWRLQMVQRIHPAVCSVIVGDCLNNLRSALEYIVQAITPIKAIPTKGREGLFFPILVDDPFSKDARNVNYLKTDMSSRRVRDWLSGLDSKARTIVESQQPYALKPGGSEKALLQILADLNNADKHRHLVVFESGVREGKLIIYDFTTKGGSIAEQQIANGDFLEDGVEITMSVSVPPHMSVQIVAPSQVVLCDTGKGRTRRFVLPDILDAIVHDVTRMINDLAPFVVL